MIVRPGFLVALCAVVLGVAGTAGVTAVRISLDRADVRAVSAVAHAVPVPDGAAVSHDCRADGLVSCFVDGRSVDEVVAVVERSMSTAAARRVTVTCYPLQFGHSVSRKSCAVVMRRGGHAVVAQVEPHVVWAGRKATVRGTLVSVTTS